MLHLLFSIYDTAAEFYSPPFHQKSKGLAIRAFGETAANKETSIGLHPNDFTLFAIGTFDDSSGTIAPLITPQPIIKANETITEE